MDVILKITKQLSRLTLTLLLYRLIQFISLPFLFVYFVVRICKHREYARHFGERLGFLPRFVQAESSKAIWLHAVSIGEVVSLLPLLQLLRERLPSASLYLSTSTVAGRNVAERQAASLVDGIFFLPFDFGVCVRRVFRMVKPALLVIAETEIWPNLLATAYDSGTSVALINARISDRTWPTYQRWQSVFRTLLAIPDLVQVQSQTDYERYTQLGVKTSAVLIDASLKFDAISSGDSLHLDTFGAQQVWIAASTVGPNERGSLQSHAVDEDDIVLSAFSELAAAFPRLLLILAPRQPARFDEVAAKLAARNLNFTRRSTAAANLTLPGVLLLDTLGELAKIFPLASVVFVGGSIAPRGGHNIIEPASAAVPVIVGPHMQNFAAIAQDFRSADAIIQIEREEQLTEAVRSVLLNPSRARELGRRALAVVERQRGITKRTVERLVPLFYTGSFQSPHAFPIQTLLNGLARLWVAGGAYKRRQGERYAAQNERLPVPVVSIGGLAVGGAGKTPFTVSVARLLIGDGFRPAVLTRGYKRRSRQTIVAPAGSTLPLSDTGDEAQIFLRSSIGPVGIGANRYQVGRSLLNRHPDVNVLLLDDGFQHARLRRNVDVVLIDGLNPFGNGRTIPAGRLREPLAALTRAKIAVVTRCTADEQYAAIAGRLRGYNSSIQVFRTDTVTAAWRDAASGETVTEPNLLKTAAFCGLGNPQSFWATLDSLGIRPVQRTAFRDHHQYAIAEIHHLQAEARKRGAEVLLTTEKDFYNLPKLNGNLQVLYLPIELVVRDAAAFIQLLKTYL